LKEIADIERKKVLTGEEIIKELKGK